MSESDGSLNISDLIEGGYSSLPSKAVNQCSIPVPENFDAKFQYNYFVSNEMTTREVSLDGDDVTSFAAVSEDDAEYKKRQALIEYDLPRFVMLSWSQAELESVAAVGSSSTAWGEGAASSLAGISISENLENIIYEETMTNSQYCGIAFQDAEGLDKITDMAKVAINSSDLPVEFASAEESNSFTDSVSNIVSDYFDMVDGSTPIDTTAKELMRSALSSYQSVGELSFFSQTEERDSLLSSIPKTGLIVHTSVSNAMASRCGNVWGQDGGGIFYEEVNSIQSTLDDITEASTANQGKINSDDYELSADPVTYRITENIADLSEGQRWFARVFGYIIEKFEIDSDGNVTQLTPLSVEGAGTLCLIDPNVMYGKAYRYQVRTVAYLEYESINVYPGNESRDETCIVGILVASRPSEMKIVSCIESVPPGPPADISFIFDKGLNISWAFPLNRQRDIRQFRIFRRASVGQPFSLIKNYFFDDSEVLTKTSEIPDPDALVAGSRSSFSRSLIQVTDGAMMSFTDIDFDFNSSYIYALTSVDAHGMSSNYSAQFIVAYDKFKSQISTSYLSRSGAPVPYPNLYLKNDLFADTIRTSGFNQVTVYFDPEYASVNQGTSWTNYLGSLFNGEFTGQEAKESEEDVWPQFKINMLNVDNQKSKTVDIYIKDIRDRSFEIDEGIEYNVSTKVSSLI